MTVFFYEVAIPAMVNGTVLFIDVHRCREGKEISHLACVTPTAIANAVGMIYLRRGTGAWVAITSPGGLDLNNTQKSLTKLTPSKTDSVGLRVASTGSVAGTVYFEVNEA